MTVSHNAKCAKTIEQQTIQLLFELTSQLKLHMLWQEDIPSLNKLSSSLPFCCDTLTFEQWLQFIFIPKIKIMIADNQPLPISIALTPMAEESFKVLGNNGASLIEIIARIDQLFGAPRL